MKGVITSVAKFFWGGLKYTFGFLLIILLGALGAILYALPWILRGLSVLTWFMAGFFALTEIETIYAPGLSTPF